MSTSHENRKKVVETGYFRLNGCKRSQCQFPKEDTGKSQNLANIANIDVSKYPMNIIVK